MRKKYNFNYFLNPEILGLGHRQYRDSKTAGISRFGSWDCNL